VLTVAGAPPARRLASRLVAAGGVVIGVALAFPVCAGATSGPAPRILSLDRSRATVPFTGGSVVVAASVSDANSCRLVEMAHSHSVSVRLSRAWKPCTSGLYRARLTFGPNKVPAVRQERFRLFARRGEHSTQRSFAVAVGGYPIGKSSNWAGYVLPSPAPVTEVAASWRIPTLSCSTDTTELAVWVGVDGAAKTTGSATVFQDGSRSRCVHGHQENYLWWEWYPSNAEQDVERVNAGDRIDAIVFYGTSGSSASVGWWWSLRDETSGKVSAASQPIPYRGPGATAEWIVEDPGSSFIAPGAFSDFPSRFSSVTFASMRLSPGSLNLDPDHLVEMIQRGVTLATPRTAGDSAGGNPALIVKPGSA
jgi:hypothetical protein